MDDDYDDYDYELISVYKYPKDKIGDIGGAGFDSGWIGPVGGTQTRVIIGANWFSPCSIPCPIPLLPPTP